MLSTTPNGGPTTYVAINGMLPTNPHPSQLSANAPGTMFAIPSGLTGPNFLSAQNFAPFVLPPLPFSQGPPNLTCAVPYSTPQLQPSLFPFLTPTAGGMLTTNPTGSSLSIPPQFNTQLPPHLLQPQGHNLASFASSVPGSASMGSLNTPNSLMHDNNNGNNHMTGNTTNGGNNNHNGLAISSVTSTMFTNHLVSSPLILPTLSFNMANPSDVLSFSLAPQCTTTATTTHPNLAWSTPPMLAAATTTAVATATTTTMPTSLMSLSNSVTPNVRIGPYTTSSNASTSPTVAPSVSVVPSSIGTLSSVSEQTGTTSSLPACKPEKTATPAITTTTTAGTTQPILSASANMTRLTSADNLHALELVDFHRDVILDAIDKLRERKARPDFERISCLLKRHQNINPDHTQVCLGRLAAAGAVVCVDYKGNLSYRNPSKWRKTATNSTGMNPIGVSQRLVDAVRRLMIGTTQGQLNPTSCADPSIAPLLNAQPGPNGGYSLFQIERALQAVKTTVENVPGVKPFPELTGATLRVCLDREATHGKLAKNPDGRYVLDEFGERKKQAVNKKPIPPSSSSNSVVGGSALYMSPNGPHNKYGKFSGSVQPIAPAGEYVSTVNRPLAVKQTPNGIGSLNSAGARPLGLSPIQPLLSRTAGAGRRGRPPGLKSRRHSVQTDTQLPLEKKIKSEPWPSTTEALTTPRISSSIGQNATTMCTTATPISFGGPLISVAPNGFCTSTSMSLPTTFIPGLGSNGFGSTILSPSILPTSFSTGGPPMDFPLSLPMPNAPFMTYSAGMAMSAADGTLPLSSVAMTGASMTEESRDFCRAVTDRWLDSPSNTVPSDSVHSDADSMVNEKMEAGEEPMLCSRCCEFPTKEEPFLICKDCNLGAHPTCLDYWPELTERARQSPWQCSDCKSCHVCHGKAFDTELLVCDACDKGFHSECHVPKLQEPVDRSLPWVCADCQKEGYSVAIGTLPGATDATFPALPAITTTTSTATATTTTSAAEVDTPAEHGTTHEPNSAKSMEAVKSPGKSNTDESESVRSQSMVVDSSPTVPTSSSNDQPVLPAPPDPNGTIKSRSNSVTPSSLTPTQNRSIELPTNTADSSRFEEKVPVKPTTSSASVVVLVDEASPISRAHTSPAKTSQSADPSHISEVTQKPGSSPLESQAASTTDRSPDKTLETSGSHHRPSTMSVDNDSGTPPPPEQRTSSFSPDQNVCRNGDSVPTANALTTPNHPGSTTHITRPDDIRAWSMDHVRDWLLEEGFPREAEAFFQQEIDGACLLLMKRMDVLTELGIKLGPAVKIYERIKRLQSRCTSPTIL